jgi:hypothetical protein
MLDIWIAELENGRCISENDLKKLCNMVKLILIEEANVQKVASPVAICGDIHGQFYDLLELFRNGGPVPSTNYIFMVRIYILPRSNYSIRKIFHPIF